MRLLPRTQRVSDREAVDQLPDRGDWVWPAWLRRQLTPGSGSWRSSLDMQGADKTTVSNTTLRNWTRLGIESDPARWLVDPYGLVCDADHSLALDLAVRTDRGWRCLSQADPPRQSLVESSPVLETTLRIGDGDLRVLHWVARGAERAACFIRATNTSSVPVALAVSLRPFGVKARTGITSAGIGPNCFEAGGVVVASFAQTPLRVAVGDHSVDSLSEVMSDRGVDPAFVDGAVRSSDQKGWANATGVWSLSSGTSLTFRLDPPGHPNVATGVDPDPLRVAGGWGEIHSHGPHSEGVVGRFGDLEMITRSRLVVDLAEVGEPTVASARLLGAAIRAGLHDEAGQVIGSWLDGQNRSGQIGEGRAETAAALWCLDLFIRLGGDRNVAGHSLLSVGAAARRLISSPDPGPDQGWSQAGLRSAVRVLGAFGEREAAAQVQAHLAGRDLQLSAPESLRLIAAGAFEANRAGLRSALRWATEQVSPGGGVIEPPPCPGVLPSLVADTAATAALAGVDPRPWEDWLTAAGGGALSWPEVVDPLQSKGCQGSGYDPLSNAAVWNYTRCFLLNDRGPGEVRMLPSRCDHLLGVDMEVHGYPSALGNLSFALRWHGDRPALLWDIEGAAPEEINLSCGLDPTWTSRQAKGEALLAGIDQLPEALKAQASEAGQLPEAGGGWFS